MKFNFAKLAAVILAVFVGAAFTFSEGPDPKSKSLIDALYKVNGGWEKLWSKNDVQFTYVYKDFAKGTDISVERYIFEGESSFAEYQQHEVNVMPGKDGVVKQCYMDGVAKISLDGNSVTAPEAVGGTEFLRVANYYWFAMMYKIDDPGAYHKYLGQEEVTGVNYDKVSLTYKPAEVGKEVNDEYILYFNPKTHMIDQFMFSLPAMGVNAPILKMELDYELIDGIYIATTRRAFAPNEKGEFNQMGEYLSKNIKFNNKFKKQDFKI